MHTLKTVNLLSHTFLLVDGQIKKMVQRKNKSGSILELVSSSPCF